jgi:hypothetical protein
MNFDDIFKPTETAGETITSYYNLDDDTMSRNAMSMLKMMKGSEVLDTYVIDTGLALTETKDEAAVLFYLLSKALVTEIMNVSEETSRLLDFTRKAVESMGEEAQTQYASLMIEQMLEAGMIGDNDDDDEF